MAIRPILAWAPIPAAFLVKYFGVGSIEIYILVALLVTGLVSAAFGYVCVRHTRIFFGILTLALSQVLWTLAYKFFWVTGGTDGLRVAFANLTLLGGLIDFKASNACGSVRAVCLCAVSVLHLHGAHVGDRAFAVRQSATSDP